MEKKLVEIEITVNEAWPVTGHIDLTDPSQARHAFEWNDRIVVTEVELARLNKLADLEHRVGRLYHKLLMRVEKRDLVMHKNDDGSVIIAKEERNTIPC